MKTFKLEPTDNRKSFYNKAIVLQENNISKLQSYSSRIQPHNK